MNRTAERALTLLLVAATGALIQSQLTAAPVVGYVAKPLAIGCCIALAWFAPATPTDAYRRWVLAGLACSAVGDVLLMLPRDLFAAGLAAFLVAHLFYIRAFVSTPTGRALTAAPLVALVPVVVGVLTTILPGVPSALRVPVLLYITVIAVMGWQALGRAQRTPTLGSRRAALGAVLFLTSDAALAVNRFSAPFAWAPIVVLGTYFAAQWCIARSVGVDARAA